MGSATKSFNKALDRSGLGVLKAIHDPLKIGANSDENNPHRNPQVTISGPATGQLSEADAAALHNRYMSADAIKAEQANRSPEMSALLRNAMAQSQGLSSAENAAIRSNALSSVNSQNQMALNALRGSQAASGVRGGLAQAQMAQQYARAANSLGQAERDLVADNINFKREGLRTAGEMVTNQENIERDLAAQRLNTVMAIRGENAQLEAARMQAQAAANQPKGGK